MRPALIISLFLFVFSVFNLHARLIRRAGSLFDTLYIKEGWVANGLPSINYNIDLGFEYGAVLEFYQYRNERILFPVYDQFFALKSFRTTKGAGSYQIKWDNRSLFAKTRVLLDVGYFTDDALGFYGFNGASSLYVSGFEQEESAYYISRMFYRISRQFWHAKADFQYPLSPTVRVFYGVGYQSFRMGPVDVQKMNDKRFMGSPLPDTVSLFSYYVENELIPGHQFQGGNHAIVRLGIVRDTRPVDIAPSSGSWSELMLLSAPSVPDLSSATYLKLALTHRQYIGLNYFSVLAYRFTFQPRLFGDMPYYAMPFLIFSDYNVTALGGHNSLRGIIRNRIVGEGYAMANVELRMTCFHFLLGEKHDVRLIIKPFMDVGMVTQAVRFANRDLPDPESCFFSGEKEKPHLSYGLGGHVAVNRNFIISADLGFAADPNDGTWGLYLGTGYRF